MKITKDRIVFLIIVLILVAVTSSVSTYATSYLFNSSEVSYNNNTTGIDADNVQGAIDTLYEQATDYSELKSHFENNPISYFDGNGTEEWLNIKNSENGNRGIAIKDISNVTRGTFYYNPSSDQTRVVSYNSAGNYSQGSLDLRGNPVQINGTNIGDYYKVTATAYSVKTKTALGAHSGNSFNNLLASLPSVTVPSGYTLVSHTHIELSGAVGVYCFFDANTNTTKTSSIGGFVYNSSNSNVASGTSVNINIISLWKKN